MFKKGFFVLVHEGHIYCYIRVKKVGGSILRKIQFRFSFGWRSGKAIVVFYSGAKNEIVFPCSGFIWVLRTGFFWAKISLSKGLNVELFLSRRPFRASPLVLPSRDTKA